MVAVTRRSLLAITAAGVLATALAGVGSAQEDVADGELSPEAQDSIGAAWLDQLNAFYASGAQADAPAASGQGLEQLRAFDWRFAAAESGALTFEEAWTVFESEQWDDTVVGDQTTSFELRIGLDAQRLAETKSAATGKTVEMSEGAQRRAFNATFIPDGSGVWMLDSISEPGGGPRYEFGFRKPRPAVPCPRLGNPANATNPYAMKPWCTAGGDGRELKVAPYKQRDRHLPDLYFDTTSCGYEAAFSLWTGWPPGEPMDPTVGFQHTYVYDPRGEMAGVKGYRRNGKLPRDAVSTGVTNGYATLWTSEKVGDKAVFVQVGDRFEKWPRDTSAGCASN